MIHHGRPTELRGVPLDSKTLPAAISPLNTTDPA